MKKLFKLTLACIMLVSFAACSDKDDKEAPTLSIDPGQTALAFSAAATESFVINVSTNQDAWDAVSDQTWCKVEKSANTFKVTANPNSSTNAPAPAKITVKAGTAQPIVINVTQSGFGAELSVSPQGPLLFSAEGTESYEITVTTNQASWDAISDQTWCKIEKSTGKFIVTASQNLTEEEITATITISANNAANVTITVNQAAKSSGGTGEDTGKTIWDDTHWRLFKLKANPKQILNESGSIFAEFNTEGKITYFDYERYEYDNKGRLIKITELSSDDEGEPSIPSKSTFVKKHKKGVLGKTKSTRADVEYSKTFEYGDHSKYVASFVYFYMNNESVDYLLKGVSAVTIVEDGETNRMVLNVSGTSITGKYESSWNKVEYASTYSGNYPVRTTYDEEYDEGDGYIGTENRVVDYKYGKNYKYSEINDTEDYEYTTPSGDETKHSYTSKILFQTDATIYLLPISEERGSNTNNYSQSIQNEYDNEGRLIKTTNSSGGITTYSNYENDSKGNWIKRKINYTNGVDDDDRTETRQISYF